MNAPVVRDWTGHFGTGPDLDCPSAVCTMFIDYELAHCGAEGVLCAVSAVNRHRATACAEHAAALRSASWATGIRELNCGDEVNRLRRELAAVTRPDQHVFVQG